jgi:hypothetical protein
MAGKAVISLSTGLEDPEKVMIALSLSILGTLAGELSRRMTLHGRPVRTGVA